MSLQDRWDLQALFDFLAFCFFFFFFFDAFLCLHDLVNTLNDELYFSLEWMERCMKKCQENSRDIWGGCDQLQEVFVGPRPRCWQPGLCWSESCCHLWACGGGQGPLVHPRVFRLNRGKISQGMLCCPTTKLMPCYIVYHPQTILVGMPPQTFKICPEP